MASKKTDMMLSKLVGSDSLTTSSLIAMALGEGVNDDRVQQVLVQGSAIEFDLPSEFVRGNKFSTDDEVQLASALYEALKPSLALSPALVRDHDVWAWIGLFPLRNYVLNRWCGGISPEGQLGRAHGVSYFLTSDSLVGQARCGARRLWIAALASYRADGDSRYLPALLAKTDLYTAIFERMIGLDAEVAVEVAVQTQKESEDVRRRTVRVLGQVLSTTVLEALDRTQKAALVGECLIAAKSAP